MEKIAIIGAGISGLTVANELKSRYDVRVFEKEDTPGGLIRCRRVNGSLFHMCGGHVFNSKRDDVLKWFWSRFDREEEFVKSDRNSVVHMPDGNVIPYPIENHMYLFSSDIQNAFIDDLLSMSDQDVNPDNFEEFLKSRFGKTLYELYFRPYNEKVWRRPLSEVPLSWLEGKLPMPSSREMIFNNMNHIEEKSFVHSSFWYEKMNGSQYIADRLAEGLDIVYGADVTSIEKTGNKWVLCGQEFDKVVFCGNVKNMAKMVKGVDLEWYAADIKALEYHGTTAVFCEIDANPYSWIYQPSRRHQSHRIICTGNFSKSNNVELPNGRITATIEFTDAVSKEEILDNLKRIPLHPKYLDHEYNLYTYPIQNASTRIMIRNLKKTLAPYGFFFTGRFADWEYYNMDMAVGAALDMCKMI